jgi:lipopolysaccharide export system protein LptC
LTAISNLPFPAKIAALLLVFWLLWDQFSSDADNNKTATPEIRRSTDYSMTDFTMTIMDEMGKPVRVVKGKEMLHYPKDDSTEIIKPITDFIAEGKDTWQMQSEFGYTQGKGESILLTENVVIINKHNPEFKLLTEKLTLDTVNETAFTDQAVTILSPQGETKSVGLHADLKDETINLHSRVRGHYDAPSAQ